MVRKGAVEIVWETALHGEALRGVLADRLAGAELRAGK